MRLLGKAKVFNMRNYFYEALWIVVISMLIGVIYNLIIPKSISWIYKPDEINFVNDSLLSKTLADYSKITKGSSLSNRQNDSSNIRKRLEKKGESDKDSIQNKKVNDKATILNQKSLKTAPNTRLQNNNDAIAENVNPDDLKIHSKIPYINYVQLMSMLDNPNVILIDARSQDMFLKGKIGNSINLYPFSDNNMDYYKRLNEIERGKIYIVYCDGGSCDLSHQVADDMLKFGFNKVFIYHGGWTEWEQKNKK